MAEKKNRTDENKVIVVKNENSSEVENSPFILSNGLKKYFTAALKKLDFIEFGDPSEYLKKKHSINVPTTELSSIWVPPIFNDEHTNKEITFLSFLEESNPQLVLADPGCGKSTLSRFLTCNYIKKYKNNEQEYFGIFVPLDRFRKPKNIEEEIAYCAAEFVELESDSEVLEALKENIFNACIIFDGYDESPSSRSNQSEDHPIAIRPEVAQMISSLTVNAMINSENEKQQRFIVLCRRIDYKGYKKESQLSITPKLMTKFSSKQMDKAVVNWHEAAIERIKKYDPSENNIVPNLTLRLKEIQSVLLEHSDLAEICLTPFMLNALQTVDLDAKDLPSSVSQLCWRAVNWFFIDKHHEPDKVLLVNEFGKCILDVITEIGFSIQESVAASDKPKILGEHELRKLTKKAFKANGINEKYEDDILEQKITTVVSFLKKGHGIFIYRSTSEDDEFEFVHNVFREVVAGRWLLTKEVVDLTAYALSWGWHGPIRYWAGFKAVEKDGLYKISSFVDELTQEQYKENVQAILACGEMLVEVISCVKASVIPAGIKSHIKNTSEKLCKLLEQDSLLLVQRIRIGDLLAILEDPRLKTNIEERITLIASGEYKIGRLEKHNTTINKKYEDCPAFPITTGNLKEFKIGNYLVTNKEFKEFIDDDGYKKDKYWQSDIGLKWAQGDEETINSLIIEATKVGRLHLTSELAGQRIIIDDIPERCIQMIKRGLPMYWSDPAFNRSNQPVVGINWWEALAYCKWLEENLKNRRIINESQIVRLPIEAEWETAARLCGNENPYPWVSGEPSNCALVKSAFTRDSEPPILTPKIRSCGVGLFDFVKSQFPIYDLVGNVWEWTSSKVHKYSQESFKQTSDLLGIDDRIARGSSWLSSEEESSQITFRSFDPPYNAYEDLGFRIVIF